MFSRRSILLSWLLFGFVATCVLAQEPWDDPPQYSKLTPQQRARVAARDKEHAEIWRLLKIDVQRATGLMGQSMERDLAVFTDTHEELAKSANLAAWVMRNNGDLASAYKLYYHRSEIYAKVYGADDWRVYSSQTEVAVYERVFEHDVAEEFKTFRAALADHSKAVELRGLNRDEALAHATRAIDGFHASLGALGFEPRANVYLARALMCRADIFTYWSLPEEACVDIEDALKIFETTTVDEKGKKLYGYGRQHPRYASALCELANNKRILGKSAEVRQLLRQALDIYEVAYPGPHREKAAVKLQLVRQLMDIGYDAAALSLLEEAQKTLEQCDDPYVWTQSRALTYQAECLKRLGRPKEAVAFMNKRVALSLKEHGKDSLDYGSARQWQAHLARELEDYPLAVEAATTAAAIYFQKYGKDQPDYLELAAELGYSYYRAGRVKEGKQYLTGANAALLHANAPSSMRDYAISWLEELLLDEAWTACERGDFAAARSAINERAEATAKYRRPDHRIVLESRSLLPVVNALASLIEADRKALLATRGEQEEAEELTKAGRFAEALAMWQSALATRERLAPEAKMFIADARRGVGLSAVDNQDYKLAEQQLRPALDVRLELQEQVVTPADVPMMSGLGEAAAARGDLAAAIEWHETAERSARASGTTRHLPYARVQAARARALLAADRLVEAEQYAREAREIFLNMLGAQSLDYLEVISDLGAIQTRLGEWDAAQALLEETNSTLAKRTASEGNAREQRLRERQELRRAVLADRTGNSAEAVSALAKLAGSLDEKQYAQRMAVMMALGSAQARLGNWSAAGEQYESAARLASKQQLIAADALDAWLHTAQQQLLALSQDNELDDAAETAKTHSAALAAIAGEDNWRTRQLRWMSEGLSRALTTNEPSLSDWLSDLAACKKADELIAASDWQGAREAWMAIVASRQAALADDPYAAAALLKLAELEIRADRAEEAKSLAERAIVIYRKHNQQRCIEFARGQLILGRSELIAGNLAAASAAQREAERCLTQMQADYPADYARFMLNQVDMLLVTGDRERAVAFARRAVEYVHKRCASDAWLAADCTLHQGQALAAAAKADGGETAVRLALVQFGELATRSPELVRTQIELAKVLLRLGKFEDAGKLLLAADENSVALFGEVNGLRVQVARLGGGPAAAGGNLKPARELVEHCLKWQRELKAENRLDHIDVLLEGCDLAMRDDDRAKALEYAKEALSRSGVYLERASEAQTDEPFRKLIDRLRPALDRYLSLAVGQVAPEVIYDQVLPWKGRLLDHQQRMQAARRSDEGKTLGEQWEIVTGRLATTATRLPYPEEEAAWVRQVEFLTHQRDQIEAALLQMPAAKATPAPTAAELASLLPADTLLVDYLRYQHQTPGKEGVLSWEVEPRYLAVVVRSGQPLALHEIRNAQTIDDEIKTWRELGDELVDLIHSGGPDAEEAFEECVEEFDDSTLWLSQRLWEPAEPLAEGATTVLFSPDGQIGSAAFAALVGKDQFLIERFTQSIVPDGRTLAKSLKSPAPQRELEDLSLLVFGGVDFSASPERRDEPAPSIPKPSSSEKPNTAGSTLFRPGAFRQLLGTTQEIKGLAKFVDQLELGTITQFSGEHATENAYRAEIGAHKWLHVATHGFFLDSVQAEAHENLRARAPLAGGFAKPFDRNLLPAVLWRPDLSVGLTFAGANIANDADQDDGVLWGLEVGAKDLSGVDMAVLSACDAARGRTVAGESPLSVQWSFLGAGAKTIVSTLWPVNDYGTNLFMRRYYQNLLGEKRMPKAEALREAQLWMLGAARKANLEPPLPDSEFDANSSVLPARMQLPAYWAPFIISGDWR